MNGIAVLAPMYYKCADIDSLVEYLAGKLKYVFSFIFIPLYLMIFVISILLKEVASAAPNTPMLYYHFADKTGVNFSCVKLIEKAKEMIPTFAGVKFTGWDMGMAIEAKRRFGLVLKPYIINIYHES